MKLTKLFTLLLLCCSVIVQGQDTIFKFKPSDTSRKHRTPNTNLDKIFKDYKHYVINDDHVKTFLESSRSSGRSINTDKRQFTFDLMDQSFAFDVRQTKIFSDDYVLLSGEGTLQEELPLTYAGTTKNGKVSMTVSKEGMHVFISTSVENFTIEPLKKYIVDASADSYIFYKDSDLKEKKASCHFTAHDKETAELEQSLHDTRAAAQTSNTNGCLTIRLALAATNNMRTKYGSVAGVQSYIASVVNNVNTDYDDSFIRPITFEITTTYVASSSTDGLEQAITSSNPSTILTDFRTWAEAGNLTSNTYDIGSLFSNTEFDGDPVGLAWGGTLCHSSDRYNIVQDWTSSSSKMRQTLSHEIAHLFGCGHTTGIMSASISGSGSTYWDNTSKNIINNRIVSTKCNFGQHQLVKGTTDAIFHIPNTVCRNETLTIKAVNSRNTTSYNWSAPQGSVTTGTNQTFSTMYTTTGSRSITLTTNNAHTCSGSQVPSTLTKTLNVANQEATAALSCNPDYSTSLGPGITSNLSPTRVVFGSIDRTSPFAYQDKKTYEHLACEYFTTHNGGDAVSLSVTSGTTYPVRTKVWIDYNNDGTFNDSSEKVMDVPGNTNATNTVSVTLPTNSVKNRILRMRVITDLNGINGGCHVPQYGQVEDYGVIINGAPTCTDGIQNGTETGIDCGGTCDPCPCTADADGDGVCDDVDLDDDNDGILDTQECASSISNDSFSNGDGGGTHQYTKANTNNVVIDFNTLDNSAQVFINNVAIDKIWQLESSHLNSNTEVFLKYASGGFVAPWVANTNGLPRLRVTINSSGAITLQGTQSYNSTSLTNVIRDTSQGLSNTNLGTSTTVKVVNQDQNGPDGMTGTVKITYTGNCDIDGDGIPNSKDLDSDNDGCVDAIEGAKTVSLTQLVDANSQLSTGNGSSAANKNLGTTVDANGVPTLVSGGQGAGTAYNASVQQDDCTAPDTQAPTVPTGLASSNIMTTSFSVSWNASSDNVGVTGYKVYKDGTYINTVTATNTTLTGLNASTAYSIKVSAIDAAGNESAQSQALSVTTATVVEPTCNDGIQNGNETGVDCGGSCDPCPCAAGDIDGDGVCDDVDLDDDNDGILDTNECTTTTSTNSFSNGNGGGTHQYTHSGTNNIVIDFNTLDNSAQVFINNTAIDKIWQLESSHLNNTTEIYLKFASGGFGSPWLVNTNGLPRLRVTIDSNGSITLQGTQSTTSTSLTNVIRDTSTGLANVSFGNSTTVKVVNQDQSGPDGMTGSVTMSGTNCDTDGDGIPNSKDLDSDNDGCVDAIEGAKNITLAQLVDANSQLSTGNGSSAPNKNLGTSVDANGVPSVASGGQEAGTAYDANTQQSDCTPPDTQAPSTPLGLAANGITSNSFNLTWNASSDNVGVTGYKVYKDGAYLNTVTGTNTTLTGLNASTSYNVKVSAIDAAGNESAHSNQLTVATIAAPSCVNIKVEIKTDNYGSETAWTLKNSAGQTVMQGGNYGNNTLYTVQECLPVGCYTFKITDSYGDGICCSWGSGFYKITSGGTVIQGGSFGSSETKQVCNNTSAVVADGRELVSENIELYPNPAVDVLHVSGGSNLYYEVYSVHGQKVLHGQLKNNTLDIQDLSPAVYVIRVYNTDKTILKSMSFIKE